MTYHSRNFQDGMTHKNFHLFVVVGTRTKKGYQNKIFSLQLMLMHMSQIIISLLAHHFSRVDMKAIIISMAAAVWI